MSRARKLFSSLIRPGLVGAASSLAGATSARPPDPNFSYETEQQKIDRLYTQKKAGKSRIIASGSVFPIAETEITSPKIIAGSIFIEDKIDREDKERLIKNIEASYAIPILKPIMDLVALSCLGKTDSTSSNKHFKFVVTKKLTDLHPCFEGANGVYTKNNTAFIQLPDLTKLSTEERREEIDYFWSSALHEATHFSMMKVFGHNLTPPYNSEFNEIVLATESRIEALDPKENSGFAYYIMKSVANYDHTQHGAEFIARIPEIIANDPKGGYEWLQKNTPELLKCFEEEIIPKINGILRKKEVGTYLKPEAPKAIQTSSAECLSPEKPRQLA